MQKVLGPIRRIRFTQSTLGQANIREKKGPLLGQVQVKNPHQRSPQAMKLEDRSHEETGRQKRCARSKALNLAEQYLQVQRKTRLHSTRPRKKGSSRLRKQKSREEREFVVDPGASTHMVSKKDLNSAELETMRTSRSPTAVMMANEWRGANQRRSHGKCQRMRLIRQSYAS